MENALFLMMCVVELSPPCSAFIDEIVLLLQGSQFCCLCCRLAAAIPMLTSLILCFCFALGPLEIKVSGDKIGRLYSRTPILVVSFASLYHLGQYT